MVMGRKGVIILRTMASDKLYQRAVKCMPGGVNSPVRAFRNVGRDPLFIDHANGSHLYDADGDQFIDYVCSWGPDIFGHAYPPIVEAVKKACEKGLTFGACHEGEIILAEKIISHFPSIEMVRLVNSGTEAVMSAIRAARGFTGRNKIIKFEGCYHGHSDALLVKGGSGLLTNAIPDSAGIPESVTQHTLIARYNDKRSVSDLFGAYPDSIACVIIEPCAANMGVVPPQEGFLPFLREITKKYGALLIFDEVITGFRLSDGGAQKYYGVNADLTTLGKIVGGGMPLAAYGGRREIMVCISPLGPVYQAGTLSGNPVAVAAGIAALTAIEQQPNIYAELEKRSAKLEAAMRKAGFHVNREGSLLTPFFTDKAVTNYESVCTSDREQYSAYFHFLLEHGIYVAPSQFEAMFVSTAHSDAEIDATCDVIERAGKALNEK